MTAKKFEITNRSSGVTMGTYEASDREEALYLMAKDAGYRTYDDACLYDDKAEDDLDVVEVSS